MILLLLIYYLKVLAGTLFGTGFQLFLKNMSNIKTAAKGELKFGFKDLWAADKGLILKTYAGVFAIMLILGAGIHSSLTHTPNTAEPFFFQVIWVSRKDIFEMVSVLFFMTIAYMGLDVVLKVLGKSSDIIKERLAQSNPLEKPVV